MVAQSSANERQRQQHRADQDPPQVEAHAEAVERLEQPGAAQKQRVQEPGPVLDVALGRIDPQQAGIEPVAARVQVQDPDQAHVSVGIGEAAIQDRDDVEPGEQHLEQQEGAERQQDQPAEGHPVRRRPADCQSRLRRHEVHSRRGARPHNGRPPVKNGLNSPPARHPRSTRCSMRAVGGCGEIAAVPKRPWPRRPQLPI